MQKSTFQVVFMFIFGGAAVVAMLVFAGVLPGFRSNTGGAGGTVTFWAPMAETESLKNFISSFNDANKANFTLVYVAKDPDTYEDDLIAAMASGKGPDLFLIANNMILKYADKVTPIPFTSFSQRNFLDTFARAGDVFVSPLNDSFLALPIALDPLVMYFNRDALANGGVAEAPTTWSAFLASEKALTDVDSRNNVNQAATALGEFSNVANAKEIVLMLLNQAGNPVIVRDGTGGYAVTLADSFGFSPSPAEAVFNFFTQFANPAKSTYTWNRALPEARDSFISGTLATYFGFVSEYGNIRAKNPHLNLDAAIPPQKDLAQKVTYGRVYGLAMAKTSANSATAYSVLTQLIAKENDRALSQVMTLTPARLDLLAETPSSPFGVVFYRAALIARGFIDPNNTQTRNILANLVQEINSGVAGTGDAVTTAQKEMALLLKK